MKITDFIICDDVRQEIGNKFTLVGVYDTDVRIQTPSPESLTWPLPVNLAIYSRLQLEPKDEGLDTFEMVITQDEKELARLQGKINIQHRDRAFPISARMPGFPLPGPGLIKFHLRFTYQGKPIFDGDAPKTVRIMVEKTESS